MTLATYLAFCAAALALAVVPGPTVTVIVANSLRHGARAGLLNVAGTQAGVAVWLAIAVAGLGAMVQVMGVWFEVLKWAGAAYLVYLGVKLLRARGEFMAAERPPARGSFFFQGFIVIMSNPKMLVLFGALIPPFIAANEPFTPQLLTLSLTFAAIACATDALYALAAGRAGQWLSKSRLRVIETLSGLCLIGGGLWMALKGRV
jgi:homoserine/homoserine lactone efflux protein